MGGAVEREEEEIGGGEKEGECPRSEGWRRERKRERDRLLHHRRRKKGHMVEDRSGTGGWLSGREVEVGRKGREKQLVPQRWDGTHTHTACRTPHKETHTGLETKREGQ